MKSIFLALSALTTLALASPYLYAADAPKRIDLALNKTFSFFYLSQMHFGNDTTKKYNVMIDTQNDWSFVVGSECATCYASNRYANMSEVSQSEDFGKKQVREIGLTGKSVVDKACLVDAVGANHCIEQFRFGVITSQDQASYDIDGVLGFRPQVQSDEYSFIAALYNNSMISKMEAYLDIRNQKLQIGDSYIKSMQNDSGLFISYPADNDQWQIKIRDIRYNSTSANFSSLNDTFTRHARLDTAFPGIAVPSTIWPNVKDHLLSSVPIPADTSLDCNFETYILGEAYKYCSFNTTCDKLTLAPISLQFSGVEAFLYPASSYSMTQFDDKNGTIISSCVIQLYGNSDLEEDYQTQCNAKFQTKDILLNFHINRRRNYHPQRVNLRLVAKFGFLNKKLEFPLFLGPELKVGRGILQPANETGFNLLISESLNIKMLYNIRDTCRIQNYAMSSVLKQTHSAPRVFQIFYLPNSNNNALQYILIDFTCLDRPSCKTTTSSSTSPTTPSASTGPTTPPPKSLTSQTTRRPARSCPSGQSSSWRPSSSASCSPSACACTSGRRTTRSKKSLAGGITIH